MTKSELHAFRQSRGIFTRGQSTPFDREIAKREVRATMTDSPLDLNPDPMVIPTLTTFKTLGDADSFALDLKSYIDFVLTDPRHDPLSSDVIY